MQIEIPQLGNDSLSVLICSRNRHRRLRDCLNAFPAGELAACDGQLVLVDNGSTDETESVMRDYQQRVSCRVDLVVEPKLSLSRARNTGLKVADGNIIVFTDDDCYLGPGYLETAHHVFDSGDFQFCGGRIFLHDPTDDRYGCNDLNRLKIIRPHGALDTGVFQGCNLVVLREVVDRVGGFELDFGPAPFRAEDIDFCAAALDAGFSGAHVPELVVFHHHGRKPGSDIQRLKRDNDSGRGAYYTKWILRGRFGYAALWLWHALSIAKVKRTAREIAGGTRYWRQRRPRHAARRGLNEVRYAAIHS